MSDFLFCAPRIAFLGLCERAALVREGHPVFWGHNLIGLRNTLGNFFYPCGASGWSIVFACYEPFTLQVAHIRLVDESGEQLFNMDIKVEHQSEEPKANSVREQRKWQFSTSAGPCWFLLHQPLKDLVIRQPGMVRVLLRNDDKNEETCVGMFSCVVVTPPLLTEDRIAAIRADPRGAKFVQVVLGCKNCSGKFYVKAGIEKPKDLDGIEKIWYEEAPEEWSCGCGSTTINLSSIRKNLHGILGRPLSKTEDSEIGFIRVYEKGALTDVCGEFGALLDDNPPEEEVQKFLEKNTVFFHRFSPMRIKPKAPILTKNQTDFAILDSRGVLILVEIEKPSLRLLKKDGDVSQFLQHAFGQVRTWLGTTQRRWTAVLDCMGFKEDEVAGIRGVVVAGRDRGYPSEYLMRLKGADHGQIEFYTFDDLLEGTINLTRELD